MLAFANLLGAQQVANPRPAQREPGGSVLVRVTCADMQRPARFAAVALLRKLTPEERTLEAALRNDRSGKVARNSAPVTTSISGVTAFDGSYTFKEVQPGDYYAVSSMLGYIARESKPSVKAVSGEQAAGVPSGSKEKADGTNDLLAGYPAVHVVAGTTSTVDVVLDRGGSISGTARFEDGSPVVGAHMFFRQKDDSAQQRAFAANRLRTRATTYPPSPETDDEGRYRITGLEPGAYVVGLYLPVESDRSSGLGDDFRETTGATQTLEIFAEKAFRFKEAKSVEIAGGEAFPGVDILVDLHGLHTVSGRVIAAEDRHGIATGGGALSESGAKQIIQGRATLLADGSFHISYVPPGTYTLHFSQVRDTQSQTVMGLFVPPRTLAYYKDLEISVIVSDGDVALGDIQATLDFRVDAKGVVR